MNVLDLLVRPHTPRWGGNDKSDHPFVVELRSPSRAWMLRLEGLVIKEARRAKSRVVQAIERTQAGDLEEAQEAAASLDLDAMRREADEAKATRREFVQEHVKSVRGLQIPDEAYAYSDVKPEIGIVGWLMEQGAFVLEIENELRRRGTVTKSEGNV